MGCRLSDAECRTPVFSTQLVGSGIATIELSAFVELDGRVLFDFVSVNYAFNVPEPISLLLLASGWAALGATKLKRR